MIDKLIKTKTLLIYVEVDSLKRNIELDEQQKEFFELVNSTDVDVVEQNFNKQKQYSRMCIKLTILKAIKLKILQTMKISNHNLLNLSILLMIPLVKLKD
jgi:hypothetical protein